MYNVASILTKILLVFSRLPFLGTLTASDDLAAVDVIFCISSLGPDVRVGEIDAAFLGPEQWLRVLVVLGPSGHICTQKILLSTKRGRLGC